MAAGIPKEKATEDLKLYANMLMDGGTIGEMDYWRALKELQNVQTPMSITAIGFLHAVAGKMDKAISTFEDGINKFPNISIAENFCFLLRVTNHDIELRERVYSLADNYASKNLSLVAYSSAYRFGDRENLIKYLDMHIKYLSEEEGRTMAEKHKNELLSELDDAFDTSGCTKNQFNVLATIIWGIVKKFKAKVGPVELSKNGNCCYIIDIVSKDPKTIAQMNYALAEEVCMEPQLDNCNLIARFSSIRELHTGVSYGYFK